MSGSLNKLFISYSSKDQTEVSKLISALRIQKIEAWDYSGQGQELDLAREVKVSLREKIDSYEYFIAVISPNSLDKKFGKYTRFEVRYAIESGKFQPGKILPVLINVPDRKSWHRLYPQLNELKYVELNFLSEDEFERSIREICKWLSVDYKPSSLLNEFIFFTRKFRHEFEKFILLNKEKKAPLPIDKLIRLESLMDECAKAAIAAEEAEKEEIRKERWEKAKSNASRFLEELEEIDPKPQFYYPVIIKGGCELKLEQYEDAEKTYLYATTDLTFLNNSLIWQGYFGLGHTYFSLYQYDKAILAFKQALAFGKRIGADISDTDIDAIKINLLGAILQAEKYSLDESVLNKYDFETVLNKYDWSKLQFEERLNFLRLKGTFYYKTGNYAVAAQLFQKLGKDNLDEASAMHYSLVLGEIGEDLEAVKILEYTADKLKTANLYYYLTGAYFKVNKIEEGLKVYEDVLCNPKTEYRDYWSREFFICYALTLKAIDNKKYIKKINSICEKVLDAKFFSFPETRDEYYYTGFANYLLGRDERAKYDYERSKGDEPYKNLYDDYYNKLNL